MLPVITIPFTLHFHVFDASFYSQNVTNNLTTFLCLVLNVGHDNVCTMFNIYFVGLISQYDSDNSPFIIFRGAK